MAVEACLPPPGSVQWLQQHVGVLHLLPPDWGRYEQPADVPDYESNSHRRQWMRDWVQRRCGPPNGGALWRLPETHSSDSAAESGSAAFVSCIMQYREYMRLLMEGLTKAPPNGIGDIGAAPGAPLLELAACRNLQVCGARGVS